MRAADPAPSRVDHQGLVLPGELCCAGDAEAGHQDGSLLVALEKKHRQD